MAKLVAILSEDNSQLQRSLDVNQIIDDTTISVDDGGTFTLAPSALNSQVLFPKVTAGKYIVLLVWSGEVQWKVNNTASQALALKPNPPVTIDPILPYQKAAQPGIAFIGPMGASSALTALYLTNPSSTVAARVQVAIVGNAT